MAEKTKTTKQTRVARTIKVSTLIKTTVLVLALAAVFVAGYFMGGEEVRSHNQQVKLEASKLVSDLKANQAK